ncbi:unnamed protein product [Didymodactylos carnosus]|uniref:S phase cyclin A-associated protein in the endoplasmic reticulum n=1 Tax=Didymodactylos carnosus TaxID=1234261 RepID=A0A8S2GQ99_9BILA|nr:unnamed protein product [Didymodactylos carnosus]CAF3545094.1 unnamed protein product [Didymodactylos carnosus]
MNSDTETAHPISRCDIRSKPNQTADIRSRYWTYLFDNLKRSIDQLYQTCENDESIVQCQEVVLVLFQCYKDFNSLIKRFEVVKLHNKDDSKSSSEHVPFTTSDHVQSSMVKGDVNCVDDDSNDFFGLNRKNKRLHNSDINLNNNNCQKLARYFSTTIVPDMSSQLSLPSLFSTHNHSSATLTATSNTHLCPMSETKFRYQQHHSWNEDEDIEADDEKEELDHSNHYSDDEQIMDFMDQQVFDVFDQEECLTAALEAEQERTIASLMLEQEHLEKQLNDVNNEDFPLVDGDDVSELEESELSTTKTSSYFMSLQEDRDEKDNSPLDGNLSRDENDSEAESKSRNRYIRIHEKLSSPSRVRPLSESLKEAAERQERALRRRKTLQDEKARKLRELTQRVGEVRQWKEELIKARKTTIEIKMQRAEEKRQYMLVLKAKKAADEDLKGQEIAFIKLLQQENRKHTLKERYQKEEQFKQFLEDERIKKHEEHKQRELAAENRRKELEAIRQTRLMEMQEKWKIKERMIEQHLIEKRKQKQTAAIAKQKSFQQKRALRVACLKASTTELQKKLAQKQEETTRRHVTQLEEIRRRAMEMSVLRGPSAEDHVSPTNNDGTATAAGEDERMAVMKKFCTLCNLLMASELHLQTHLKGKRHNQLLIERHCQKDQQNGMNNKQLSAEEAETINSQYIMYVTSDAIVRQEIAYNRERKHQMKKRAKKLRLRTIQRSAAYEAENAQKPYLTSTHKARIQRFLNELEKALNTTTKKEPMSTTNYFSCQRVLTELTKIFDAQGYEKDAPLEQRVFFSLNGYSTLNKLIELRAECNRPPLAPEKFASFLYITGRYLNYPLHCCFSLVALTAAVYRAATNNNVENALYVLNSGKVVTLAESLVRHITGLKTDDVTSNDQQNENEVSSQIDLVINVTQTLVLLLTMYNSIASDIKKRDEESKDDKLIISRITDLISYMANIGCMDKIAALFRTVRGIIQSKSRIQEMIIHFLSLLQQMLLFAMPKSLTAPFNNNTKKSIYDPAQVISIMKCTNFCEILSLLYGLLIQNTDNQSFDNNNPCHKPLQEQTLTIVLKSTTLLNTIAILDMDTFQTVLGEETISLQLRHVANFVLWYCNSQTDDILLRQIILLIGYYCVLNQDNQLKMAVGNRPTVLQQLSCLPFRYFVDQKQMEILFPTLIACSYDCDVTKAILSSEMSLDLISKYIDSKQSETSLPTNNDNTQFHFYMRFPRNEWKKAIKYYRFAKSNTSTLPSTSSSSQCEQTLPSILPLHKEQHEKNLLQMNETVSVAESVSLITTEPLELQSANGEATH